MNFLEKILLTAGLVAVHNTAEAGFVQKVEKPKTDSSLRAANADLLADMEIIREVVAEYKNKNPHGHIKNIEDALKTAGEFDMLDLLANERIYSKKSIAPHGSFIRYLAQILMTEYKDGPGEVFIPGNEADVGREVETKSVLSAQFTQRFGHLVQTLSEHLKKELGLEQLPFERSKFMAVTVKGTSAGANGNAVAGMVLNENSSTKAPHTQGSKHPEDIIREFAVSRQMKANYCFGALIVLGALASLIAVSSKSGKKQKQEQRRKELEDNSTLRCAIFYVADSWGSISSDLISCEPKDNEGRPQSREFWAAYFIPDPGNPSHGTLNMLKGNWYTAEITQSPAIIEEALKVIREIHLTPHQECIDTPGKPTHEWHVEVPSASRAQLTRLIKEADKIAQRNA